MWTPRRIVLLVIGFAIYLTGYLSYARSFFGAIDGLPALPQSYLFVDNGAAPVHPSEPNRHPPVEEKLKRAFGAGCEELGRAIKLDINSKRMVLAADKFQVVEDNSGRVMLTPISVALFDKDKGNGDTPAINTIRAKVAYLRFDRPVSSLADMNGRKITEAELIDDIRIVNNRKTPLDRTDDLVINIPKGPMFYEEARHLIWTHDTIHLKDMQCKPKPNEVWGKGMEMELQTEATPQPANSPVRNKAKQETISGAKKITLMSDVVMYLYVDSGSSFPSGSTKPPAAQPNKAVVDANAPKALINIKTPGHFIYEFGKGKEADVARFEVPENDPKHPQNAPQDVTVERIDPRFNGEDQLVCQKLTLKIRRRAETATTTTAKPKETPAAAKAPEQAMDIESMHATGSEVVLISDAENLKARCVELDHNTVTNKTILRGKPNMWASKEGNQIQARELQLTQVTAKPEKPGGEAKRYQDVLAIGPGQVDMIDKETKRLTTHAFWNDKLTMVRTEDYKYNLLTLTGAARFVEDGKQQPGQPEEPEQSLRAETIKVWLEDNPSQTPNKSKPGAVAENPAGKTTSANPGNKTAGGPAGTESARPHHLEAKGNVTAIAKGLNVHDSDRLAISFKDVGEKEMPDYQETPVNDPHKAKGQPPTTPPAKSAPRPKQNPTIFPGVAVGPQPGPGSATPSTPGKPNAPGQGGADKKEPTNPIDLRAGIIQATVYRRDSHSALKHLWCESEVRVLQDPPDPKNPAERGVNISGDTLELEPHPEGHQLHVTGDLAQLEMGKIYITGPEIKIDQVANKAWVNGAGMLKMLSATTFSGDKLKEPQPMEIYWDSNMVFNGSMKLADFSGDIQAKQGEAHLMCQTLQVVFDRPISLREGNKDKDQKPAQVQNMLCDKNVKIEEEIRSKDEKKSLIKYSRLTTGGTVTMDKEIDDEVRVNDKPDSNRVTATGPGTMRVWQPDSGDSPLAGPQDPNRQPNPPPKPANAKDGEPKMKMTNIIFNTNMMANTRTNKAIFRGEVRVLSMPSDSPLLDNDFEVPPSPKEMHPDAIYLTCEQLTLLDRRENGKSSQEMEALRRVRVVARQYSGTCDTLTYNQAKDQIIFIGSEANPAVLYKVSRVGGGADRIKGKKIIYLRATGDYQVEGGDGIQLQQP